MSLPNTAPLLDRPVVSPALAEAIGRPPLLPVRDMTRELEALLARPPRQRSKLWEFGSNLHCSIIGTCLTTAELRQIFVRLGRKEASGATEHDLHASAVLVASKRHDGAKLLHKALDRRHRSANNQFEKAKTAAQVRELWREASDRGDIPGAYWAALTHTACDEGLVRELFAEVHMLSHLVGAANRADIRRLRRLEKEKAELEARLARRDKLLLEANMARDDAVRALQSRVEPPPLPPVRVDGADEITELKARLSRCEARRERVEAELAELRVSLGSEQEARRGAERREAELREELDALETRLAVEREDKPLPRLDLTLLYVGGQPARIGHLRALAEEAGAVFLYHDGGIEKRGALLPGLVSRADAVLFPVDCVSHAAMLQAKRLCRQAGKKFIPLRSTGLAPFCAALRNRVLLAAEG